MSFQLPICSGIGYNEEYILRTKIIRTISTIEEIRIEADRLHIKPHYSLPKVSHLTLIPENLERLRKQRYL